jgi:O-Antigen ligase
MRDYSTLLVSHRALFVVQGFGLLFLGFFLFLVFFQGKGFLFLAAILATLGIVIFLQKPYLGLLVFLCLWLLEVSPDFLKIGPLSPVRIIGAVLLVPLVLSILRDRNVWIWQVPQVKIFVAILILFLASIGWSDFKYPDVFIPELDQTTRHMELFLYRFGFLIFFLYFVTSPEKIELVVWLVVGLIVAAALSALPSFLTGGTVERASATVSFARNPNRLAYVCILATCLLWFYRADGEKSRWKTWTLPFLFFLPIVALAAGSRSGFLQLAILATLVLKQQKGWSGEKRIRSYLLLGTVVFLLSAAVPATLFMRATSFDPAQEVRGQESLRKRINTVYALIELSLHNPLLGVGLGNFRWMHQAFYGDDRTSHNSYLWALAEGGLGVLALYLLLFYFTFRMLEKVERAGPPEFLWLSKGLRVALILFLVFSAFAEIWLSEFLYIIIGLAIVMTRVSELQNQNFALVRPLSSFVPI